MIDAAKLYTIMSVASNPKTENMFIGAKYNTPKPTAVVQAAPIRALPEWVSDFSIALLGLAPLPFSSL